MDIICNNWVLKSERFILYSNYYASYYSNFIVPFIVQAITVVARNPWKIITFWKLRMPPKLVTIIHYLKIMVDFAEHFLLPTDAHNVKKCRVIKTF